MVYNMGAGYQGLTKANKINPVSPNQCERQEMDGLKHQIWYQGNVH